MLPFKNVLFILISMAIASVVSSIAFFVTLSISECYSHSDDPFYGCRSVADTVSELPFMHFLYAILMVYIFGFPALIYAWKRSLYLYQNDAFNLRNLLLLYFKANLLYGFFVIFVSLQFAGSFPEGINELLLNEEDIKRLERRKAVLEMVINRASQG